MDIRRSSSEHQTRELPLQRFETVFLAPFVATFLGTAGTLDFFAPIERVILAMIGIY